MRKLSYEDKLNIYVQYKNGASINGLSRAYQASFTNIRYYIKLIELHGEDILRTQKNRVYSTELKIELVQQVLNKYDSTFNIAVKAGLASRTLLIGWVQKYKENGYNIVERKRGRPTMINKSKIINKRENETDQEKIKRLEEENLYLKAELEYSKKLRAVVQARKNQQQKKK